MAADRQTPGATPPPALVRAEVERALRDLPMGLTVKGAADAVMPIVDALTAERDALREQVTALQREVAARQVSLHTYQDEIERGWHG